MCRHLFLLFLIPLSLSAQVSGRITDPAGDPLAFVSIFPDAPSGAVVVSDIEGKFQAGRARGLTFRYVGYKTLQLDSAYLDAHRERPLLVTLYPDENTLPEALVRPGENPAEALIRKAVANRARNNPERYNSFICNTYNKLSFDLLPNRAVFDNMTARRDTADPRVKKMIADFEQRSRNTQDHHAFFMETVTERRFRAPDQNQEKVLLNRVSGFRDMGLVAVANAVQPFSFYGDFLQILDKNFVNPISPGSIALYFFNIEDTLYAGPDTVWVISFRPRKNKIFDGLEGVLHLNSRFWALQNVRAQPARPNGNINIKIEQAYRLVSADTIPGSEPRWFPEQLNFELEIPRYPAPHTGMRVAGRSFIRDVQINAPLRQRDFIPEMPIYMAPDAADRSAEKWSPWRLNAPLSARENRSYNWLDSLSRAEKMGWINAVFNYLSTGKAHLAKGLSADLQQILRFNEFEGTRLGLGLTTAESRPMRLPKRIEAGMYGAYGFQDRGVKYGASARLRISRFSDTRLDAVWQHDLLEPGALHELSKTEVVSRTLYARRMDFCDQAALSLNSRPFRSLSLRLDLRAQRIRPAYSYQYRLPDGALRDHFRFLETGLFLRYAARVQTRRFLGDELGVLNRIPVVELAWTRGWERPGLGDFAYNRLLVAVYQNVMIRKLGLMRWRAEAGLANSDLPLAKLFTLNQSGGSDQGWAVFVAPNTFQALFDTLYVSDRFVNLYWSQETGPVLYRYKRSAPQLTVIQHAAWGRLSRPEQHVGLGLATLEKPLFESGLQVDNLLRFNYLNIAYIGVGGAFFYRWGALDTGSWKRNMVPRISLKMSFG